MPATVVMPTGTGKTDTMVAALVAARIPRLLVLVPSDALRDQLAWKFERLGVLPTLDLVPADVRYPVVGKLSGALDDVADAERLATLCNVVVSTPNALNACAADIRMSFLSRFTHLFVDEAHHVSAPTWNQVRDAFAPRPVVQFTATPHRADGQHLGGTLVYVFPLREAQREGYFSKIRYQSVLSLLQPDEAIVTAAVAFLREDLEAGRDHLLMARAETINRAEEIQRLYAEAAPDLEPVVVHHRLAKAAQRAAVKRIQERKSRILVCVDMFGEGFDMPQLKIAALHDPHRSLGITLQFIGRFARGGVEGLGQATVVAARTEVRHNDALRRLYAEDADWNAIVEDLSAAAVEEQVQNDEFTKAFNGLPEEISIHSLTPAMSTVVFKPSAVTWKPEAIEDLYKREALVTFPIPTNLRDGVAWFVTRTENALRWGSLPDVESVQYDLYVVHWDQSTGLLYINSSNNDLLHEELAQAISGDATTVPISGDRVFRVFHEVQRFTPMNIGLLDTRNRNRRYTSHVGSDVTEAFPVAEAQTKTQTHIAGMGYLNGDRYSIAASLKGRIWSHRTAASLKDWTDWCGVVGPKLVDASINIDTILASFIRPQDLESWPGLRALAIELPPGLADILEGADLAVGESRTPFYDVSIEILGQPTGSELPVSIVTPSWQVDYILLLTKGGLQLKLADPEQPEVMVERARSTVKLSTVVNRYGMRVLVEQDGVIEPPGVLLKPNRNLEPYPVERLLVVDWTDVNIRKESWGPERDAGTVQGKMIETVLTEDWDVVLDDDGTGEVADIVALRELDGALLINLIHCKFSSEDTPGARVADLYELVGQGQRSAGWRRDVDAMFIRLIKRERTRAKSNRTGFVRGAIADLQRLYENSVNLVPRVTVVLVQPGLSAAAAGVNQLELLASADVYIAETANSSMTVICSP